jgi:hypothetical protein
MQKRLASLVFKTLQWCHYCQLIRYELCSASVHSNNLKLRQYAILTGTPRYSLWPSPESLSSMSSHFLSAGMEPQDDSPSTCFLLQDVGSSGCSISGGIIQ